MSFSSPERRPEPADVPSNSSPEHLADSHANPVIEAQRKIREAEVAVDTNQHHLNSGMARLKKAATPAPNTEVNDRQIVDRTRANTLVVIKDRIARMQATLIADKTDYDKPRLGKRLDSVFKMGGLFGTTTLGAELKGMTTQEEAIKQMEALGSEVASASGMDALKDIRTKKLGLPALPQDLVDDYDKYQKMVAEGVAAKAATRMEAKKEGLPDLEVNWMEINKELQDAEAVLDRIEMGMEIGSSVAIGIATGGSGPAAIMGAQLALSTSTEVSRVMRGEKTINDGVRDALISAVTNAIGGQAAKQLGKMMQAGVKSAKLDTLVVKIADMMQKMMKDPALIAKAQGIVQNVATSAGRNALEGATSGGLQGGTQYVVEKIEKEGVGALGEINTYVEAAKQAQKAAVDGGIGGAFIGTGTEGLMNGATRLRNRKAPAVRGNQSDQPEQKKKGGTDEDAVRQNKDDDKTDTEKLKVIETEADFATKEGLSNLAQQARDNPSVLKDYLKQHDVPDDVRIELAEQLLNRPLNGDERTAILNAHNKPGVIDDLQDGELNAKVEELRKGITDGNERRKLIEAGICGAALPPPPGKGPKLNSDPSAQGAETAQRNTAPATPPTAKKGPALPPPPGKGPNSNANPDTQAANPVNKNVIPDTRVDAANNAKVKRPDIVNTPDQQQKKLFVEKMAKESGDSKMVAEIIADNLTHINQIKFESALEKSIGDFNASMGNDKPYAVIGGRSRKWVFDIAKEKGMNGAKTAIVTDSTEADITDLLKKNPTLKDVVLIDDAAYSGNQLNELTISIQRQSQLAGREVQIHILAPFMTNYSERLGRSGVKLYKHENIQTVQEIALSEAQKRGIPTGKILAALRERYDMRSDDGKSVGLTYFDHKIPDNQSFLATKSNRLNVLRGIVVDANGNERVLGTKKEHIPFTDEDGTVTTLEVEVPIYDETPIARQTRTPYNPEIKSPTGNIPDVTPQSVAPASIAPTSKLPPPPPLKQNNTSNTSRGMETPQPMTKQDLKSEYMRDSSQNEAAIQTLTNERSQLAQEYQNISAKLRTTNISQTERNLLKSNRDKIVMRTKDIDKQITNHGENINRYEKEISKKPTILNNNSVLQKSKLGVPENKLNTIEDTIGNKILEQAEIGRPFTEIRNDLSKMNYLDLLNADELFKKEAARMNAAAKRLFPNETPLDLGTREKANAHVFKLTHNPQLAGTPMNKSAADSQFGGYQLQYGKGIGEISEPHTTFYFNPRETRLQDVISTLDKSLVGCNAQIKISCDNIAMGHPEKIVVYFDTKNREGINRFIHNIAGAKTLLDGSLNPLDNSIVPRFKIPISGGISFVERMTGDSWDANMPKLFPANNKIINSMLNMVNYFGNRDISIWKSLFKSMNLDRNRSMPGLERDLALP